jgi:chromosome segregation ATPase
MRSPELAFGLLVALFLPAAARAGMRAPASLPPQGKKDYLSESEADKIRDAYEPAERIALYMKFAEDRLKKFQYELNRKVQDRRRAEVLNNMLNAYTGCMDDAADQIAVGQERQADIRGALKLMKSKGNEYLDILEKLQQNGAELDTYKDTLLDAIDGTKDALTDVDNALKTAAPPPVRRKQS